MVRHIYASLLLIAFLLMISSDAARAQPALPKYKPTVSKALYDSIATMDSLFFDAYNNCKLQTLDSLISEDLEFYHDMGGLTTSKADLVQALKNNICGKVTRELLKGSIEVYEIKNYGAVEMGFHGFHNNQEKKAGPTHFAKFVHIWRKENGQWKLSRVISLH